MNRSSYWPSAWPVECGGNHRPKSVDGPGLDLQPTERLVATTRHTGGWPVMFVQRDPGELYLYGTSIASDPAVAGWVERVDPRTLQPMESSGPLSAGDHEWCGSVAVHANGDLYVVNGSRLHRLDHRCRVVAELELPVDHAHNGLLILSDGSIVTKDIRLGDDQSTLTICSPDLELRTVVELPEASMGRIASVPTDRGDTLYVPGATGLHRLGWDGATLSLDPTWQPRYRAEGSGGLAWDLTVVDGWVWFMDNGDISPIQHRFSSTPTVRSNGAGHSGTIGPDAAPWSRPLRLIAVSEADGSEVKEIVPFSDQPGGWVIAPPLVHDGVALTWDTANMGLTALDVVEPSTPVQLWRQPFRPSMQPMVYARTGEVVLNDFRILSDTETSDDVVVVDLRTGMVKGRVATGANRMNGMFLCPGWGRDLYYCSFGVVARVHVQAG